MKNKFTVKSDAKSYNVLGFGFLIFLIAGYIWAILETKKNLVYIAVGYPLLLIVPSILGIIWVNLVYISVNKNLIEIRNMFGIKKRFDVNEITKMVWRTNYTKFGTTEKISVKARRKKFSYETLMENSEKMSEYILENVSSDLIIRKTRKYKGYKD